MIKFFLGGWLLLYCFGFEPKVSWGWFVAALCFVLFLGAWEQIKKEAKKG
jgi:hypothetical protein